MNPRSHSNGITQIHLNPFASRARVGSIVVTRPTLRCTRTPPALPFALSQLLATSASFSASAQAVPVSFIR
jgi:hypothetical protein